MSLFTSEDEDVKPPRSLGRWIRRHARLPRSPAAERRLAFRELGTAALQLSVLCAFAVAQPLFEVLADQPEFFVAHDASRMDIVVFAVAVVSVPPALLLLAEAIAALVGVQLRRSLHLVFVSGLIALVVVQVLEWAGVGSARFLLAAAVVVGIAGAVALRRFAAVRSLVTVLAPAPAIFVALFLLHSPVARLVRANDVRASTAPVAAHAPVVVVVFDEFTARSLLDARGRIDAARFPNFARFANTSTWFPNATSFAAQTTEAVPAILTGRRPNEGDLPILADHPDNLFTLLGRPQRTVGSEAVTRLCPPDVCERLREPLKDRFGSLLSDTGLVYLHVALPEETAASLPSVSETWTDFGGEGAAGPANEETSDAARRIPVGKRVEQVHGFVRSLGGRPDLAFLHVLLPHKPWTYLPSGKSYGYADVRDVAQGPRGFWRDDDVLRRQAYQRYLLQLGFTDRLLGKVLGRLNELDAYDKSLIVVTADHGISFARGVGVRGPHPANVHEVGSVPLLIKAPGQRQARVVDHHVQIVDILPTIADLLGVDVPWRTHGRSALDSRADRSRLPLPGGFTLEANELDRRREAARAQWLAVVGPGREPLSIFRIGPRPDLVGRSLDSLAVAAGGSVHAELDHAERYAVDIDSSFVPTLVAGRIEGGGPGLNLAVAVNGRIGAVTRSFDDHGRTRFAALVPEWFLVDGENTVSVFAVSSGGTTLSLVPLGGTS